MTITSPLELHLFVSNQGVFNVSRVSDRSALISWMISPLNPLAADLKSLTGRVVISRDSTEVQPHQVRYQVRMFVGLGHTIELYKNG